MFRPRRSYAITGFLFFLALAAAALGWPWLSEALGRGQDIPEWLTTVVGIMLLIFASVGWRSVRGTFRADSWLVMAAYDGLYVRFRSHLNFKLPDQDPVIVFIPNVEVGSLRVRRVKMKKTAEVDGESAPLGGEKYLEIRLFHAEQLAELEAALAEERQMRGDGKGGSGSIARHYPVRVLADGIVEVDWAGIYPGLNDTVKLLGQTYSFQQQETLRAPRLEDMDPAEREEQLAALVQRGERILAIKLARKFYGYDLKEAQAFLDDLAP